MILHILKRTDWADAVRLRRYEPATLNVEGFIHCSKPSQLIETANGFYRGQSGLIVICIDERRVESQLRYEAPAFDHAERTGERFPHIYGPLDTNAVARVVDFPCEPDGSFRMPAALTDFMSARKMKKRRLPQMASSNCRPAPI